MKLSLSILSVVLILNSGYERFKKPSEFFDSNRFLPVEGKPFFPIGIYSVNPSKRWDPPSAFEEIRAAGFNTVHTYEHEVGYLEEYARKAESAGLKVLVYPGSRMEQSDFNTDSVKTTVRNLGKSPAILSWYLAEEPDAFHISPGSTEKGKDIIQEMDPLHPVSIIISDPQQYRTYAKCSDVFMIERYPVPRQPIVDIAEHVDLARKAVGDKIPVWAVLQAFGYQNEKNNGWGWKREPSLIEMKAMTYLAIVQGARGIFYFTYHGSQYFIKESPRHWDELKALVGELRDIYPLLVSHEVGDRMINASFSGTDRNSLFWTVRQVTEGSSSIQAGTHVIAVSGANKDGTATFELTQNNIRKVRVIRENRALDVTNGFFSDRFGPYEVHIYGLASRIH